MRPVLSITLPSYCVTSNAVAVLVLGGAHGHPVGDVVAADNHTACVHTGVAHCTLEFAGIFHNLRHFGVGHGLLEVVDIVDEVAHRLFQLLSFFGSRGSMGMWSGTSLVRALLLSMG